MASVKHGSRNLPLVKIRSVWSNVARSNVAWINVAMLQLISVRNGHRKLTLKFGQNQVTNSLDIVDMDKCHQDKCCMDKCPFDICLRLSRVHGY